MMDRGSEVLDKIQEHIELLVESNSDLPEIECGDEYKFSRGINFSFEGFTENSVELRIYGKNISGRRRSIMVSRITSMEKIFINACEYLKNLPRRLSEIYILKYSKPHACRLFNEYCKYNREKKLKLCGLFFEFEKVSSFMGSNQVIDIYLSHLRNKIIKLL